MIKIEIINQYEIEKTIIQYFNKIYTIYYYDFEGVMVLEERHKTIDSALTSIKEKES